MTISGLDGGCNGCCCCGEDKEADAVDVDVAGVTTGGFATFTILTAFVTVIVGRLISPPLLLVAEWWCGLAVVIIMVDLGCPIPGAEPIVCALLIITCWGCGGWCWCC